MKTQRGSVYLAQIQRRYKDRVYLTYLLRRSFRENGKVRQQTLANLTHLPPPILELVRQALKGVQFAPLEEAFEIVRTRSHGHVAAVRAMLRQLGLHELLDRQSSRMRDLAEALIIARIVGSQSKLASHRWWQTTTLPEDLDLRDATLDEIYEAMDWLLERQQRIEAKLAERHLGENALVLYDLTSTYYEGTRCPLAAFGHNRDRKKGKRQIVFGLITDSLGRPISVQVYRGNTSDPATVNDQVEKLRKHFKLKHVILVGDRGMLTQARIEEIRSLGEFDWVSALRSKAIRKLMDQGLVQPSLFDERDLMEIASPDYPGERLVVCHNSFLQEERRTKREELLKATEAKLAEIARLVAAGKLKRQEKIAERVGRVINTYKVAKHFECEIAEGRFNYRRKPESIRREAELDGFYVIRTSVPADVFSSEQVVLTYKNLSVAEQAFRIYKSVDLKVRPIHHHIEERVRAHIFLCTLAYYVEWHLRQAWAPFLFEDETPGAHEGNSPVRPAHRSQEALRKASTKKADDGQPVHSLQTLLAELGTVGRNTVRVPAMPEIPPFDMVTTPTPFQMQVFQRAGLTELVTRRQKATA